jgi:hypothetical protein
MAHYSRAPTIRPPKYLPMSDEGQKRREQFVRCRAEADKPRVVSERSHHTDYHRAPLVSETQTYSGDQSVLQCATSGGHGLSVRHQIDLIGAVRAGGRSDSDEDDKPSHLVSQPSHRSILPPRWSYFTRNTVGLVSAKSARKIFLL